MIYPFLFFIHAEIDNTSITRYMYHGTARQNKLNSEFINRYNTDKWVKINEVSTKI